MGVCLTMRGDIILTNYHSKTNIQPHFQLGTHNLYGYMIGRKNICSINLQSDGQMGDFLKIVINSNDIILHLNCFAGGHFLFTGECFCIINLFLPDFPHF